MTADDKKRYENALIYGTSHPEAYMTKADYLWEKYSDHRGNGYKTMARHEFYAALSERDEYFTVRLNKKQFGQLISELQELHDQMIDVPTVKEG